MNQIGEQLNVMYLEYWNRLKGALADGNVDLHSLSNPFLIDADETYQDASTKILFVGKETNGWGQYIDSINREPEDAVCDLQNDYIRFRKDGKWRHTPFWRACRIICDKLNSGGPKNGYMTSNLIKLDQNKTRPSPEVEEIICNNFPLLYYEINILRPDVVLFFTGPYYDDRLQRTFAGSVLEAVNGMPLNLLCRVIHDKLPYHSYRTYHPGYSLRGNKAKVARFDPVVDAIVNLVQQ
ncbi:hypothetical protein P4H70_04490 [Paenibacillus ehimensis]|uniref:hypothetical protein n=1 Tax=Paenibacillus ehimensis TaxID=79264 RepID=UPI002DBB7665|nr:hypothetical protein [Paenibacillus ehimensis]MEC0208199.1 hypothetical protein [Paenibacillus ehimensis]